MSYAEYVGLVGATFSAGWLLGAVLTMSRVRAAERVLHLVAQELAVPSNVRRAVADYFDWER